MNGESKHVGAYVIYTTFEILVWNLLLQVETCTLASGTCFDVEDRELISDTMMTSHMGTVMWLTIQCADCSPPDISPPEFSPPDICPHNGKIALFAILDAKTATHAYH